MEARLVRLTDEQLERLREKLTTPNGVVVYVKPDWLHAAFGEGITEEEERCPTCGCERECRGPAWDFNPDTDPYPPPCPDPFHTEGLRWLGHEATPARTPSPACSATRAGSSARCATPRGAGI